MTERSALADGLNAEWAELAPTRPEPVARWAHRWPAFSQCGSWSAVLTSAQAQPDGALAILIAECQAGDQLAGRVVVQAMLGKIILMGNADHDLTIDDYLAALWLVICSYPLRRRPQRVAANLALDTRKLARRDRRPLGQPVVLPCSPEELADRPVVAIDDQQPRALRLIQAARQLGVINDETSRVMTTVYAEGYRGNEAATRHQITPEMVRYRCSDGARRMQRHAAALREAA